jgi:hypothetical protein
MINLLSLSFSALSPRCVMSDWRYLDKIPIMNAVPPALFLFLLAYQYVVPRVLWVLCFVWAKLFPRRTVVSTMVSAAREI